MPGPARLQHKFSKSLSDPDNCSVETEEFLIKPKMEKGARGWWLGWGEAKTPDCLFHVQGLLMTRTPRVRREWRSRARAFGHPGREQKTLQTPKFSASGQATDTFRSCWDIRAQGTVNANSESQFRPKLFLDNLKTLEKPGYRMFSNI